MCEHDFEEDVGINPSNPCEEEIMFTCRKCGWWESGGKYIVCKETNLEQIGLCRTPSYGTDSTLNVCLDCGTKVKK